jgi:hypothetical protein
MGEAHFELADCEATLLREIADPHMRQLDVASTYGLALLSSERTKVDWSLVNTKIAERWPRGLGRVKQMAWRVVKRKGRL